MNDQGTSVSISADAVPDFMESHAKYYDCLAGDHDTKAISYEKDAQDHRRLAEEMRAIAKRIRGIPRE